MAATLYDRTSTLLASLHAALAAPGHSGEERAVHDAWRGAIRGRSRRIVGRAERLCDPVVWEIDVAAVPVRLRAALWTRTVAEVGALHGDLAQALLDHERTRPVWRAPRRVVGVRTPGGGGRGRKAAPGDAAQRRALQGAESDLARVRRALRRVQGEVRATLAALQEAEEARLAARVRALPEHTADREQAEDLLLDLAQGRLDAKRCDTASTTVYGTLLRRDWLRPRTRLLKILEG